MEGTKRRPVLTPAEMKELLASYCQDMTMDGERTEDPTQQKKLSFEVLMREPGKAYTEETGKAVI